MPFDAGFGLYVEWGIRDRLASGSRKSCERAIAGFSHAQLSCEMKTNESSTTLEHSALAASNRRSFPLRTLMVCFTIWLVATEILVFDQIKFNAKAELLEQATRAIRGSQLVLPTERASSLSRGPQTDKL